jgi:hypothetical protein
LWIVPDFDQSTLSRRIDWYLNFQIHRFIKHSRQPISPALQNIIKKCELKEFDFIEKIHLAGLLISSSLLLPNRWVYYLKATSNINEWVQQSFDVWSKLHQPSLRFILPKHISAAEFRPFIEAYPFTQNITVIAETSA